MLKIFISCFYIFIFSNLIAIAKPQEVPQKAPQKAEINNKQTPTPKTAEYDFLQLDSSGNIFMSGNVDMNYENKKLSADNITILNAKEKEFTILKGYGNIKLIDEEKLFRGRSILYDMQKELAFIRFAFFQQINKSEDDEDANMTVFANELESRGKLKIMDNAILTACFPLIENKEGFLNECFVKNTHDFGNKYDLKIVKKRYNKLPWYVEVERLELDQEKEMAKLHNLKFNIYGMPILKLPYLKYPTNMLDKDRGANGFLIPRPVIMGTRQQGIEIPYYKRFSNNKDLVTSINLYGQIPGISKDQTKFSDPSMNILDNSRMRETFIGTTWRHLIDNDFGKNSFYTIEGAITDETKLISSERRAELDSNGNYMFGHRGYGAFNGLLWLSKDTSLRANYMGVTDPNFMYIYFLDMKNFVRNNISLSKVNDTIYSELEVNQFKGIMSYIDKQTTPVNGMFNSDIKLDMPKKLGRLNFENSFVSDKRESGFSRDRYTTQLSYKLPFSTQKGSLFAFNSNIRGDWYNTRYGNYNEGVVNPGSQINNTTNTRFITPSDLTEFVFGNYGYMMENPFYTQLSQKAGTNNFNRTLSTVSLEAEHPFVKEFKSESSLVLSPKIMLRRNTGSFNLSHITNEDGFDSRVNYSSLFAMNSFASRDIVDIGTHAIAVLETRFKNKNGNGFEFGFGKMQRLADESTQDLPMYTGFRKSGSDYLSYANFNIDNFSINSQQRFSQQNFNVLESRIGTSWANERSNININYTIMARDASFVNRELNFLNFTANHYITERYRIELAAMYNMSTESTIFNSEGKPSLIRTSIGIIKDLTCMEYGVRISRADLNIPGLQNNITARFIFNFKGF